MKLVCPRYNDVATTQALWYSKLSAAEFWKRKGLNELADIEAFQQITRRVNGGLNGIAERLALYATAKAALGLR